MKNKIIVFIKQHLGTFCIYGSIFSILTIIFMNSWWLAIPVIVLAIEAYLIRFVLHKRFIPADNKYWYPTEGLIKHLVPKVFEELSRSGYSNEDYQAERNDCDDYANAGAVVMHNLLLEYTKDDETAKNKAFPIFIWSFRRKNGSRHRLFFIIDDKNNRYYIENYPVFDKYHDETGMYRLLSPTEELNGYIIS